MGQPTTRARHGPLRIRLAADVHSVPAARQFARDALTEWHLEQLSNAAVLCVGELAANAALHSGGDYLEVALVAGFGEVRLSVEDHGPQPNGDLVRAAAAATDPAVPDEVDALLPTTGRGLVLVAALATEWGIEDTPTGTRVWVWLTETDTGTGGAAPSRPHTPDPPVSREDAHGLPAGWQLVRLVDCPVGLALAHSQHLQDLLRELQLVEGGTTHTHALGQTIEDLLHAQAHIRQLGQRLLADAAAAGRDRVDLELPMPPGAAERIRALHRALDRADLLCRQEQLLTLAATTEMVGLRAWVEHELVGQVEHRRSPLGYDDWLRHRPSR